MHTLLFNPMQTPIMEKFLWHILHFFGIRPTWETRLLQEDDKLKTFNSAAQSGICGCTKKWDGLYINRIKYIKGWK
jgi:hypothetical protein